MATVGFHVEQKNADDTCKRINQNLLYALPESPYGAHYLLADPGAQSGRCYRYRILELENTGQINRYGPFDLKGLNVSVCTCLRFAGEV